MSKFKNQEGFAVLTVLMLSVALFMLMMLAMDISHALQQRNKAAKQELQAKAERFNSLAARR